MSKLALFDTKPKVAREKKNQLPENPEHQECEGALAVGRFPSWLHRKLPKGRQLQQTESILSQKRLHTVCEEAKCPNIGECWSKKTATFLILGKECTRSCGFCDIDFAKSPKPPEDDEPERIALSAKELELSHIVLTMVARDDLPDGGAEHLCKVIRALRHHMPSSTLELLTSDFAGNKISLDVILKESPEIFNHNIETVIRLTPRIRHKATYERTLEVLSHVNKRRKSTGMFVKSGLMVGLGETTEEVEATLRDLRGAGCDIVTIGQYLQPNRQKLLVKEFIAPHTFDAYAEYGRAIGIPHMYCGPFIRSSYNAQELFTKARTKRDS